MTDILVAHHNWRTGGETAFNLSLIRALCSLHYRVTVASVAPAKGPAGEELGSAGCVEGIYSLLPYYLDIGFVMQRLLLYRSVLRVLARASPSLVWIDTDLYKPLLGRGLAIVEYLHFPYEVLDTRYRALLPREERVIVEEYLARYRRGLLRLYNRLYSMLAGRLRRPIPFPREVTPVANSRYIARLVEYIHGSTPRVLHPPVEPLAPQDAAGRRRIVVSIGRLSPEKRYEVLLEAVGMSKSRPGVVLLGSMARHSRAYTGELIRLASRLGVDLKIVSNPSREEIARITASAMAYVHTTIGEHFGITVVEAMSTGLPVIVHKSGGPWIDIVEEGRYGLGYTTPEELADAIDNIISDPGLWGRLREASLERYKAFTPPAFTRSLEELLACIT